MRYLSVPRYRVRPSVGRFLFDRFLIITGLCILLYLGIYVNFYLLGRSIPAAWNWTIIIFMMLLIVMEMILCHVKYGTYVYEFYDEKLVMNCSKTKELSYSAILRVKYSSGTFDRWFKTGDIVITTNDGRTFKLRHLTNPNQAYLLIQRHAK